MSISFYDPSPFLYYVYALICQDEDGPLYIKFGRTCRLHRRLSEIRLSSPVPARYFAYVQVKGKHSQSGLERALHKRFAARRVTGEWFRFDVKSDADKRDFNDGSAEVFSDILGPGKSWNKVSTTALDGLARDKQVAYYHATEKNVPGGVRAVKAHQNAWRELSQYGR